jgi:hypothetical protein
VLARFDAGTPALLERRVGAGRVLLWAASLDRSSSDLPINPIFPVFVQQSVLHLAGYRESQPWVTVGQVLDPDVVASKGAPASRVVLTPSGRRLPLQDEGTDVLELAEQGFYEVRGAADAVEAAVIATNVEPGEGDLSPMNPNDLVVAAVGTPGAEAERAGAAVPLSPEAQENNQRLWWYLLCAGLLLLGLDTVMSNRLAKS